MEEWTDLGRRLFIPFIKLSLAVLISWSSLKISTYLHWKLEGRDISQPLISAIKQNKKSQERSKTDLLLATHPRSYGCRNSCLRKVFSLLVTQKSNYVTVMTPLCGSHNLYFYIVVLLCWTVKQCFFFNRFVTATEWDFRTKRASLTRSRLG